MSNKSTHSSNFVLISTVTALAVGSLIVLFLLKRFQKPKPNVFFFIFINLIIKILLLK